jgi:NAD(P)-dependent dehydrogenase (short-subunit alcohol dehydrogenase family)
LELKDADYDGVLDLNARSVVIGCQAAIKQFLKQGDGGVTVNTGSVAARHMAGRDLCCTQVRRRSIGQGVCRQRHSREYGGAGRDRNTLV